VVARTLFVAPTVRALATSLGTLVATETAAATPGQPATAVVPIQPSGAKPPLLFVHPVGGHVGCYVGLSRALGADQPFYALQARGLSPGEAPLNHVAEMAHAYDAALRRLGLPVRWLGGWSMGGLVALEMAAQRRAAGAPVEAVFLIDTPVPGAAAPPSLARDVDDVCKFLRALGVERARECVDEQAHVLECEGARALVLALARQKSLPPGVAGAEIGALFDVFSSNLRAQRAYAISGCAERLVLLRATRGPTAASARSWATETTGAFESYPVDADHDTMLEAPALTTVATRLLRVVNERVGSSPEGSRCAG
jgi:thioesterase domain-containing protein